MGNIIIHNGKQIYVTYSPDDGYWYLEQLEGEKEGYTSQPFFDKDAMLKALKEDKIDWQE